MFALLRHRDFGLLWLAGLISFIGDFAFIIALPLHIYVITESTASTALTFVALFLPRVLLSSFAGVFVDRWDRKRTLVGADVLRAGLLLPLLAAPEHLALLYVCAALQGTVGLIFDPAEGALLPKLVGSQHLVAANALNSLNNNLGRLVGPALGTVLYAWVGITGAVLVDIGSFVVAALLIRLIATDGRPERGAQPAERPILARTLADWVAGLRLVRRNRHLGVLFASDVFGALAEGIVLALGLGPLVLDVLGGSPAQAGLLGTAQAVGGLIAGLLVVRYGRGVSVRALIAFGALGVGLADGLAFNAHRLAEPGTAAVLVAAGCMALAGVPVVAGMAGRQTLVQQQAADAFRGRVFGSLQSLRGLAMMLGLAVGGLLGDEAGIAEMLTLGAALHALGGVVVLLLLPATTLNEARARL